MIASFLIALREGIEAALIVGIILSYLRKVDARTLVKPVYFGVALGVLASVAVGALFMLLAVEFEGTLEQVFEGATMFLAAAILTTMILWMRKNSLAYSEDLRKRVAFALSEKHSIGLSALAFVSVFREGIETVLFLGSASFTSTGLQLIVGGALGLGLAVVMGLAIVKYSVRLDLKKFFNVTGILLILFAAGLVAHGIHEFEEAGVFAPIVEHVWDTNWLVNDHSDLGQTLTALFGYNGDPSLVEVLGYVGYWLVLLVWIYRDTAVALFRKMTASTTPT